MIFPGKSQLRIDLIADYKNIFFPHHLGNLLQVFSLHHSAGRIVREGKHQNLGLVRDGVQQFLLCQPELIFFLQVDNHGNSIRQFGAGHIGHVAGLRNQHLVSRVQHSPEGQVDGLAASHCHQRLMNRIVLQLEPAF